MIDEQSSASGHDYASDRSAIGGGLVSVVSASLAGFLGGIIHRVPPFYMYVAVTVAVTVGADILYDVKSHLYTLLEGSVTFLQTEQIDVIIHLPPTHFN